jgi:hypothetical protein
VVNTAEVTDEVDETQLEEIAVNEWRRDSRHLELV